MARPRRDPQLEMSVEEIDPTIATDWLEHNSRNRKVSERLVMIYAEAMAEGEWLLNGEPIIFDKQGRLQSGQHRLLAVIESGASIRSVVVRGAEPEAIYSLESGRRRRLTDVLTLRGEKDIAVLSSALSWTWRWEHGLMDRGGDVPTHTHQLKVLDANPDLREHLAQGRQLYSLHVSAGLMAALYHQFQKIDLVDADNFWELLRTGEDINVKHPAYAWRRWVIRTRQAQSRPTSANLAAITVKAWNAYREHRDVSGLVWKPSESFPEAI